MPVNQFAIPPAAAPALVNQFSVPPPTVPAKFDVPPPVILPWTAQYTTGVQNMQHYGNTGLQPHNAPPTTSSGNGFTANMGHNYINNQFPNNQANIDHSYGSNQGVQFPSTNNFNQSSN